MNPNLEVTLYEQDVQSPRTGPKPPTLRLSSDGYGLEHRRPTLVAENPRLVELQEIFGLRPTKEVALQLRGPVALTPVQRPSHSLALSKPAQVFPASALKLDKLPPRITYSVPEFENNLLGGPQITGQIEFEVPLGGSDLVNAATLKAMLGVPSNWSLYQQAGRRWNICSDSHEVDLRDRTEVYRLGAVQILS